MNIKLFLSKHKWDITVFLGLISVYFLTRTFNLLVMPMFTDEAIYLRWSEVGLRDSAWRYIPLTDGKPPLYHWFVMLVMATGVFSEPLIEGRVVSIIAGFMSLIFIWLLSYVLFRKKFLSHLVGIFYVISPFMLVYDRLAIVDSLLTTTSIACLFFAVLLVKYLRLDTALLFGMAVGAGMLTKASGLLFLLLSPATILVGNWSTQKPKIIKQLSQWIGLLIIAAVLSQGIYSILRLSQFYYRIEQKNYEFIIPFSEFFEHPFEWTWGNAQSMLSWQVGYLTLPWVFLIIFALFQIKRWREHLLLLAYVVPTFLAIASFNKIIFPRFLVFSTPFLIILAASGLEAGLSRMKNKTLQVIVASIFMVLPLQAGIQWITDPEEAAIPQADKNQYYQGQPSGHGVNEIVEIIRNRATKEPVFLGTDGTFGLTPDAFLVYLSDNPNVRIEGYYPVSRVPDEVVAQASMSATYFIYYNVQDIPSQENIELVEEYSKVSPNDGTTYLRLYEVKQ